MRSERLEKLLPEIADERREPRPVLRAAAIVSEIDRAGEARLHVARRTLALRATRLPGQPSPGVMIVLHDMTELRRLENLRRELVANVCFGGPKRDHLFVTASQSLYGLKLNIQGAAPG